MKTTAILFSTLLTLAVAAPVAASPEVGAPAPTFTGVTSNGESVALEDLRGKTVVLEWTNHDCPYVKKHYETGNMQTLQKDATGDGIVWLSVISSAPGTQGHVSPDMANTLTSDREAAPSHVILDEAGTIGRAYSAQTTPHMYVIDPEGTLIFMGGIDDKPSANKNTVEGANNYVRAALDSLSNGTPVEAPVTRPYGCSVKYKNA
ncbi:MAG: redoxin domain-containing protein [Pseudomonadota bacterium]